MNQLLISSLQFVTLLVINDAPFFQLEKPCAPFRMPEVFRVSSCVSISDAELMLMKEDQ